MKTVTRRSNACRHGSKPSRRSATGFRQLLAASASIGSYCSGEKSRMWSDHPRNHRPIDHKRLTVTQLDSQAPERTRMHSSPMSVLRALSTTPGTEQAFPMPPRSMQAVRPPTTSRLRPYTARSDVSIGCESVVARTLQFALRNVHLRPRPAQRSGRPLLRSRRGGSGPTTDRRRPARSAPQPCTHHWPLPRIAPWRPNPCE